MTNKKINLFFYFAGMECQITGKPQEINYIKKCYLKSPFAKFIDTKRKKIKTQAFLEIKPAIHPKKSDYFKLNSDYENLKFILEASGTFFLFPVIEQVLRKIFYILFFKNNGLILHASAVIYKNKALVFAGPSGAGKSTIGQILSQTSQFELIADNNVYLRKINKNFYIYKSPFLEWNVNYKNKISPSSKTKLDKIFILKKTKKIQIKKASFKQAVKKIGQQIQLPLSALDKLEEKQNRKLVFKLITQNINRSLLILSFPKKKIVANNLIDHLEKTAS